MDVIDQKIISLLEKNGRISHEEMARLLHVSRPAIHKRVDNLEKSGIITGYRTQINWGKARSNIRCFVFAKVNGSFFPKLTEGITSFQCDKIVIESCQRLTGEWCLLIQARLSTPEDTKKLLDYLWQLGGILETSTSFVIDTLDV